MGQKNSRFDSVFVLLGLYSDANTGWIARKEIRGETCPTSGLDSEWSRVWFTTHSSQCSKYFIDFSTEPYYVVGLVVQFRWYIMIII